MAKSNVSDVFKQSGKKKLLKLPVDDLFNQSEEDIIIQWENFSKEFREEFCTLLSRTNGDKKIMSHNAELVSKSYVSCVLDYRSSVVRHAIFAMDVFTQVPKDVVNKERTLSEISRIKDDWTKYKKYYDVIKPLALGSSNELRSHSVLFYIWKTTTVAAAIFFVWLSFLITICCNSAQKLSLHTNTSVQKRVDRLQLSTDPNKQLKSVSHKMSKLLCWNHDMLTLYEKCISISVSTSRSNLRLVLIFNAIGFCLVSIWYLM